MLLSAAALLGHWSTQVENDAEGSRQSGDKVQIPVGDHVLSQREDKVKVTLCGSDGRNGEESDAII